MIAEMTFQSVLMKEFSTPPAFADHDAMVANFFGCVAEDMDGKLNDG